MESESQIQGDIKTHESVSSKTAWWIKEGYVGKSSWFPTT